MAPGRDPVNAGRGHGDDGYYSNFFLFLLGLAKRFFLNFLMERIFHFLRGILWRGNETNHRSWAVLK